MYKKIRKKKLIEMLIECNKIIDKIKPVVITMNDEFVAGTTFTKASVGR